MNQLLLIGKSDGLNNVTADIHNYLKTLEETTKGLKMYPQNPKMIKGVQHLLELVKYQNDIGIMHHIDHEFTRNLKEICKDPKQKDIITYYNLTLDKLDNYFEIWYTNLREFM